MDSEKWYTDFGKILSRLQSRKDSEVFRQVIHSRSSIQFLNFVQAVDWKTLGITDYPEIVLKPMDLGTVSRFSCSN